MKKNLRKMIFPLFAVLVACSGGQEDENKDINLLDEMQDIAESAGPKIPEGWFRNMENEFVIDLPDRMEAMNDLNPQATIQYGDVRRKIDEAGDTTILENYLIVLVETKEEILSYELDVEMDALGYREVSIASLSAGLEEYEITPEEAEEEDLNGLTCVKSEMTGWLYNAAGGKTEIFYKFAVFESETAFYQVLSWCIADQKEEFNEEMEMIINSFSEKS